MQLQELREKLQQLGARSNAAARSDLIGQSGSDPVDGTEPSGPEDARSGAMREGTCAGERVPNQPILHLEPLREVRGVFGEGAVQGRFGTLPHEGAEAAFGGDGAPDSIGGRDIRLIDRGEDAAVHRAGTNAR